MKKPLSIQLFQVALVLAGVYLLLSLWNRSWQEIPAVGAGLLAIWALWLFSNLCADVSLLHREVIESLEDWEEPAWPSPGRSEATEKKPDPILMAVPPPVEIGDRVFKADETKTCSSCSQLDKSKTICRWDGISLARITLTAVGCQHWCPDLHVTSSSSPEVKPADSERPEKPES